LPRTDLENLRCTRSPTRRCTHRSDNLSMHAWRVRYRQNMPLSRCPPASGLLLPLSCEHVNRPHRRRTARRNCRWRCRPDD
jgi:hypothetical protein